MPAQSAPTLAGVWVGEMDWVNERGDVTTPTDLFSLTIDAEPQLGNQFNVKRRVLQRGIGERLNVDQLTCTLKEPGYIEFQDGPNSGYLLFSGSAMIGVTQTTNTTGRIYTNTRVRLTR